MRGNTLSGRRKMFGWTAVAFIAAVIILCGTIHIFASSGDSRSYNKYYTSVRVEEGDTIWSIADRYIADSQVSKRDYVDEICWLNWLMRVLYIVNFDIFVSTVSNFSSFAYASEW